MVEYARRRHITVVPEIELPGHSSAAIAAYPFLSCTPNEPKKVNTRWGVKDDVYCPSPETFKFLEEGVRRSAGTLPFALLPYRR